MPVITNAAEEVLIDLSFALAEIALSGAETEYAIRAAARIKSAMAEIRLLAPLTDAKANKKSSAA